MGEKALERAEGQVPELLALPGQPLLERRLADGEALEQVSGIEIGRRAERRGRALGDEASKPQHVHVDGGGIEGDGAALDGEAVELR